MGVETAVSLPKTRHLRPPLEWLRGKADLAKYNHAQPCIKNPNLKFTNKSSPAKYNHAKHIGGVKV